MTLNTTELNVYLKKYIDQNGKVDYQKLKESVLLISEIEKITSSKEKNLTYWLNVYNLLVIKGVLEKLKNDPHWSGTKSFLSRLNFFALKKFKIDGKKLSLYQIENKIIRKEFKEPRIHFALNCASTSCPILPNTLFQDDTIDVVLDNLTKDFINNESNVKFNLSENSVTLNPIFKWYKNDFDSLGILAFLKKYHWNFPKSLENPKILFSKYDWSLNSQ
jgi:hypothetical protein